LPETENPQIFDATGAFERPGGRLLSLDLGLKRVGVALSDELGVTVRPLPPLGRSNWKELLRRVAEIISSFDARGLVIGLPLNMDGSEGEPALDARRLARNFSKSLSLPVFLQDERLTSREAESELLASGVEQGELRGLVDSAAAAIILRDFLARTERPAGERELVQSE
jgi:putative Holliday junction resolvase